MKHKFDKKTVIDAVGILDIKDDKIVLLVGEQEIDFIEDIVKPSLGTEVHFKSDLFEV